MIEVPEIRLATPSEATAIADMSRDYIEQGLGWSWTPGRIAAAIADQSTNVVVLARPSIALAGFAIMQYGERSAHLALLGVHPLERRRGIAARLLAWLEKCADTAGIEVIRVEARSDNPGALAFYRKHCYLQTGRLINYYRGALDAVRFEKTLRAALPVDGARQP